MRKIVPLFLAGVFLFLAAGQGVSYARQKKNLYAVLSEQEKVRTFVGDILDASGETSGYAVSLKKILEDNLAARMTINFELVSDRQNADIVINCKVLDRKWGEHDPLDIIHTISSALTDVSSSENYARMEALFTVERGARKEIFRKAHRIVGRGKVLWQDEVLATITREDMSEEQSLPLLEERLVKVFMRRCFGRNADLE
ncbi:MAG: hypothetical protein GF408_00100 [Candidatus Omnitrophica bacterium]|nr:hypothetical protein [Candidatus Omnitrophota bacterium]